MVNADVAMAVVRDIRTYQIMSKNENYRERLYEAYLYIKSVGIKDLDDFCTRKGLLIGAFDYYEVTIFDRIQDEEYLKVIDNAMFNINNCLENYINNPNIGDNLASWGKLGYTPKRKELIRKGDIVYGLTEEESIGHFK